MGRWAGEVDRVLDVRQAPSLKGRGLGTRSICLLCNKEVYLFDDEGWWFATTLINTHRPSMRLVHV